MNNIIVGDALTQLKRLESNSIDCCVTSPPYWALRDYKTEGQLGLEPTFNEYIDHLIEIFTEVKRIIKETGSIWIVIGDTYSANKTGNTNGLEGSTLSKPKLLEIGKSLSGYKRKPPAGIPEKSLIGIPERFKIRMIDELGLICRNTIIWFKPNCMPSSAKDRFTIDFEYIYFFTKSQHYHFETQYEPLNWDTEARYKRSEFGGNKNITSIQQKERLSLRPPMGKLEINQLGRMKRCVWKISTRAFSEAHFAVYPTQLIEPIIKAACPESGIVLDPFFGAGTTGLVALKQNKQFLGIEINKDYVALAYKRLEPFLLQTKLQV